LRRSQELEQCQAGLGADGELQAKVEENTAQLRAVASYQLHGHGPSMPVLIGCGDAKETPPCMLIPITRNRQDFDWGAEPGPLGFAFLVFADAVFDVTVAPIAEARGQAWAQHLGALVQFRDLPQGALERYSPGDRRFEPCGEPFGTCNVHVAHVFEGMEQSDFDPRTMLGRGQSSDECLAALVALHERNHLTTFEVAIIALGLEVGSAWQTERSKTVEPQRLRIALPFDQDDVPSAVQAVQPVEDRAEALWLLVPKHAVVPVR
jgi:hypothetical protein